MLVMVGPGATAFTRMPLGPYMNARRLRESRDRVLRRGVGDAGGRAAERGLGGGVHDRAAALGEHRGDDRAHELHRAGHVDPHHAVPHGIAHVADRSHVVHDPGDVREAVDGVAGGRDDPAMPASSVMSPASGDDVGAGVLGDELVETLLRDVDGDHASAFAGDAGCRGSADARPGAGDDHGLAGEAALVEALGPLAQLAARRRWRADRLGRRRGGGRSPSGTSPAATRRTRSSSISWRERALAHLHESLDREAPARA